MARSVAFLADVHGNALALEAVLADIAAFGADVIVNLGDDANGPLEPARCVELLRAAVGVHVRGNGDRLTAAGGTTGSTRFAAARLDDAARAWLGAKPRVARGDGWFACHGGPDDDEFYLLEEVGPHAVTLRADAAVAAALAGVDASLIVCGHTHVPRLVRLADGRVVMNPGSVGLPAYAATAPWPHRMETGEPHARWALARFGAGGARDVELRRVAYDWEAAARQAEAPAGAAWSEWAAILRSGRA